MQDAFWEMRCVWDCFGDFQACNLNTSFGSGFFQLGSRLLTLVLKQKVYGTSSGVVYCSIIRVFVSGYVFLIFVHFHLVHLAYVLGGGSETSCQLGPHGEVNGRKFINVETLHPDRSFFG